MASRGAGDPSLTAKLSARNGSAGLSRKRMADGGDVFSGPTASRALKAVGARAMTMDNTIIVGDDFDASRPEDAALYAHEKHHQEESGGVADGHGPRDAEEIAARAIERMVLHRAQKGEDLGSIMRDVQGGGAKVAAAASEGAAKAGDKLANDPMAAYQAMLGSGKSHEQVVRELAQFVLESLNTLEEEDNFRRTSNDFI